VRASTAIRIRPSNSRDSSEPRHRWGSYRRWLDRRLVDGVSEQDGSQAEVRVAAASPEREVVTILGWQLVVLVSKCVGGYTRKRLVGADSPKRLSCFESNDWHFVVNSEIRERFDGGGLHDLT